MTKNPYVTIKKEFNEKKQIITFTIKFLIVIFYSYSKIIKLIVKKP